MSRFNSGLSVKKKKNETKQKKSRLLIQMANFLKKEPKLCFVFVNVWLFQHFNLVANCLFAQFKKSCREQFIQDLFWVKDQLTPNTHSCTVDRKVNI